MKKILFLLSVLFFFLANACFVSQASADTCTYYTQPDQCQTPPLGGTDAGKITGHTYLIKKCGTNDFSCVADCTKNPNTAHCPGATSTSTTPATGNTAINVIVALPGIGTTGNVPQHTTRPVTVELYTNDVANPGGAGTTPIKSATGTLNYDNTNDNNAGNFVTTTPIAFSSFTSGSYQILIKVPQYLYQLATNSTDTDNPHVFTINANTTTTLAPITLAAGDVAITGGQVNHLNIFDYNVLRSCYGGNSSCPVTAAGPSGTNLADLNDDGQVDIIDLNIWLRSLSLLQTNQALGCDQGDCQGD